MLVAVADRVARPALVVAFPANTSPLELHVALLGSGLETRVERGENRNRTLGQEFVVLAHETHASQTGKWEVSVPQSTGTSAGRYGLAVWISEPGNPAPIQATGGWLPQ